MNLKLVVGATVALSLLLVSCGSPPTTTTLSPDALPSAQATVNALAAAQPSGDIPHHFLTDQSARVDIVRTDADFDINAYFGVLTHLSVEPGWVIDYLYQADGMGGNPFVYARPVDRAPYASFDEYAATAGGNADTYDFPHEYLNHIETDDTREGYFQFVALMLMADQFYLFWHAGYNDTTIVGDAEALEKTMAAAGTAFESTGLPKDVREQARGLDLTPTVGFPDEATAVVRMITFSKWGGFAESKYTISRQYPHGRLAEDTRILIEYDCGVQF
jgi:hypothetical protein